MNIKYTRLFIILIVASILYLFPVLTIDANYVKGSNTLSIQAYHTAVFFISVIACIIAGVMPIGAIGLISIALFALINPTNVASSKESIKLALSNINNSTIWLIVVAYLIARGFLKTGLGKRIALYMIKIFGKSPIGLAYGLMFSDLIIAPGTPSNTARCGGIVYPIANSLARQYESTPENNPKKLGTYLMSFIGNSNDLTANLFVTASSINLVVIGLAAGITGHHISWLEWFKAASVPTIIGLILLPFVVYVLAKPELKKTPLASQYAKEELIKLGKITKDELILCATMIFLLILWIFGKSLGVDATTTALLGLSILLLTKVLSWDDVKKESSAYDTLIWFAALLMLAAQVKNTGFVDYLGFCISSVLKESLTGVHWSVILIILNAIFIYIHYFFASGNAKVLATYSVFLTVAISLNVPPLAAAFMFAFSCHLSCSLTQYTHAKAPILYGSGYVPTATWWKVGFFVSLINQIIFASAGLLWLKFLGIY